MCRAAILKPGLLLDMNDGGQSFVTINRNADLRKWANSRAAVVAAPPKVCIASSGPLSDSPRAAYVVLPMCISWHTPGRQ